MRALFVACFIVFASATFAQAQMADSASTILIYEMSGKQADLAFIDRAREGAQRAAQEFGIRFDEHPIEPGEDAVAVFERYASAGSRLIIGLGYQHVQAVATLAERYENTYFVVIDGKVPPLFDNVQSVIFRDNEGAFLVGMLAALQSKTGTIGFIGGMDVPVIRNFAAGYKQGAHYANPRVNVLENMIGTSPQAFSNPAQAAKLAREQINSGADVLFAAAGGSSVGMLNQAANYAHVYAIGVDINQNSFFPGSMLTSMIKRVDKAVYSAIKQISLNTWQSGVTYLGIKEGALDYAVDIHNRRILTPQMINAVEAAKDAIMQKRLMVEEYSGE